MPKNIIVLSDGTGQEGGRGHDTNVYKLFRMLEDRTADQIVFYDQGLGTSGDRLGGMVFGAGIDKNILECYRFLFDHYESGDKIFLFGFSRGAATVRSLASFIHYFGILPASRPDLIKQAYSIYKNRKRSYDQSLAENPEELISNSNAVDKIVNKFNDILRDDLDKPGGESDRFVRMHPNQWVQIEFLGVWDTVPALGLVAAPGLDALLDRIPSWRHQYHNFKLRGSVKHACHALSIDDDRKWFFPSIWKEYDPDKTQRINVEQVWFGGSHTDVGGGFFEAGFSDIALEWMVQKAFEHGIRLHFDSRPSWNFCVAPDPTDEYHNPRSAWGKLYSSGVRNHIWDPKAFDSFGPPRIHRSVLDRVQAFEKTDKPYEPCILDPNVYPYESQIDAWLIKEYCREAYREWCKDVERRDPQVKLPYFWVWMPQLFLKKRMSESDNPAIVEIAQRFLPQGMPTREPGPRTTVAPETAEEEFTKWMLKLDNTTLKRWETLNRNADLRQWFSRSENAFLETWAGKDASPSLLINWLLDPNTELRKVGMSRPEEYVAFLIQTMQAPNTSFLTTWFEKEEYDPLEGWVQINNSFQRWVKKNKYELADFGERKILAEEVRDVVYNPEGDALVTRHMEEEDVMTLKPARVEQQEAKKKEKILVLRDYDRVDLAKILADMPIFTLLRDRVQRIEKKSRKPKGSAQQGVAAESETKLDPQKYRITRDAVRWGFDLDKKPDNEASEK